MFARSLKRQCTHVGFPIYGTLPHFTPHLLKNLPCCQYILAITNNAMNASPFYGNAENGLQLCIQLPTMYTSLFLDCCWDPGNAGWKHINTLEVVPVLASFTESLCIFVWVVRPVTSRAITDNTLINPCQVCTPVQDTV